MTHTFEIKDNFYLDGKPFQIISGGIHYFRVVPEYWKDRLEKLKAMGCNTVETYIPWNMHEPNKGEFHFDGMLDIAKFVKTKRTCKKQIRASCILTDCSSLQYL